MPRAGQRIKTRKPSTVKPPGGRRKESDALAHNLLARYMEEHFEWMLVTGYSADTVRARRQALHKFIAWADERGLDDPREITKPMLERYQRFLFYYRKPEGKEAGGPLSIGMQCQYLAPLKTWFRWLSREHHIQMTPADLAMAEPAVALVCDGALSARAAAGSDSSTSRDEASRYRQRPRPRGGLDRWTLP